MSEQPLIMVRADPDGEFAKHCQVMTAAKYRSRIIQELIEKAHVDAADICQERYLPDERAKVLRYLADWLKSQIEGVE